MNFFIGKVLQVFYYPSTTVVKTENLKEGFWGSFFSSFVLLVIRNYVPSFLQIEGGLKLL